MEQLIYVYLAGVFASSWIGAALVGLGEYIIRKLPLVKHIYNAAKQVSGAVSPDHETANSFRYEYELFCLFHLTRFLTLLHIL